MAPSLADQVASMRRQFGRLRRVALVAAGTAAVGTALLLPTPRAPWMIAMMAVLAAGYLWRKLRQERWARRAIRQLRLEEQFVQHGPTPEEVLTCVRRRHHLWTHSLTLRSLERLLASPPSRLLGVPARQAKAAAVFQRGFRPLTPARFPVDLLWFAALGLFWLLALPEALLQTPSSLMLAGLMAWLAALGAEVALAVLQADMRAGCALLTRHLGRWTLARQFDALVEAAREQAYQHTRVYHARHLARRSSPSVA